MNRKSTTVPFHGPHQAGVATRAQAHVLLLAYDLPASYDLPAAAALRRLLTAWSALLADAAAGTSAATELTGADPARLTATLGVGPALLRRLGRPLPEGLTDLPAFDRDALDPGLCGGDLLVQLCADDVHVLHQTAAALTRLAGTRPRWRQAGFRQSVRGTPRNLLAFKDGTENPPADDVWLAHGPFAGGTCMVVRRVALDVPAFTAMPVPEQEAAIGRSLASGAPLGARLETDPADLALLPASAHLRVCHHSHDGGARMLRRGYSYAGDRPGDEGLLFIAFMRDLRLFTAMQRRMDAADALTPATATRGSAVFAVLPGVAQGGVLGLSPLGL
jgi:dye decolorizing peroxidase/deferrochelatase/peroxidase EfeB